MENVHLTIHNNSGLTMQVENSDAGDVSGPIADGATWEWDTTDGHNANAVRFFTTPGTYVIEAAINFGDAGTYMDPGWQSPFVVAMTGDANGVDFDLKANGGQELQPWDLMAKGGTINVTFSKV